MWTAGTRLHRGHKAHHADPAAFVPPATGDTRFAPYPDTAHVYLAQTTIAALLESALHDTAPPAPLLPRGVLRLWLETHVELTADVRLVDLRDAQLARLGIGRHQLVATSARHYRCTRAWAAPLRDSLNNRQPIHGLVWTSRQAELHAIAIAHRPAVADLLDHHPTDVAVLWAPPADPRVLRAVDGGRGPLAEGDGLRYLRDLANVLEIAVE